MEQVQAMVGKSVEATAQTFFAGRSGRPCPRALRIIAHSENESADQWVLCLNSAFATLLAALVLPLSRGASSACKDCCGFRGLRLAHGVFARGKVASLRGRMRLTGRSVFWHAVQAGDLPGFAVVHCGRADRKFAVTPPAFSGVSKLDRLRRPRRFIAHTDDPRGLGKYLRLASRSVVPVIALCARPVSAEVWRYVLPDPREEPIDGSQSRLPRDERPRRFHELG